MLSDFSIANVPEIPRRMYAEIIARCTHENIRRYQFELFSVTMPAGELTH